MKKVLCLLLALCMIVALVPTALAGNFPRYLALGDSITAGTSLNVGEECFPQILARNNNSVLDNRGLDGMTAQSLYASFADGSLDEAIASADLITITAGGNDVLDLLYELMAQQYNSENDPDIHPDDVTKILADSDDSRWLSLLLIGMEVLDGGDGVPAFADRPEFDAKVEEFMVNLYNVMEYIRALNPDVPVIIPTQYNPYKDFTGLYKVLATSLDAGARKLNRAIEKNAHNGGYLVADVFSVFDSSSEKLVNATTSPMELDFHPNARGHVVMAEILQQVIDQIPEPEPQPTEPQPTEPQPTEPEPTEPQPTEPEPTEPEPTEPEPTEPEPTEPEPTEPEPTEPEPTEPAENPFTDVAESAYYYEPVLWAVENSITGGTSATTFGPGEACTRGQIVTFLWAAAGRPEPASENNPFTDVKADAYYYKAVLWAVENNITGGTSATTFSPNSPCTRAQVVTFLWAAQDRPEPASAEITFSDVKATDYYAKAVLWAVENGVTSGVGGGRFGSGETCTRGQIVTFLFGVYA